MEILEDYLNNNRKLEYNIKPDGVSDIIRKHVIGVGISVKDAKENAIYKLVKKAEISGCNTIVHYNPFCVYNGSSCYFYLSGALLKHKT